MNDRLPLTICWHCDRPLDAATGIDDDPRGPTPGAISLCLYCGAIARFTDDLRLEPCSDELLDKLATEPEFRKAFVGFNWARQRVMIRDHLLGFEKENP